jgi:hypothetical protein
MTKTVFATVYVTGRGFEFPLFRQSILFRISSFGFRIFLPIRLRNQPITPRQLRRRSMGRHQPRENEPVDILVEKLRLTAGVNPVHAAGVKT